MPSPGEGDKLSFERDIKPLPEEDRVMVEVDFAGHVGTVRGPGHDDISDGGDMVPTRYQTTVHCASLFE